MTAATESRVCWHEGWSDWDHKRVCPAHDGDLIRWGRCRSGRRWFWAVTLLSRDAERDTSTEGYADTEEEAVEAAAAAVVKLAADRPTVAYRIHRTASHRLKELNAERRRERPASGDSSTGPVEFLYGIDRGYEDVPDRVESFQITRKTAKRIYYVRDRYSDEVRIGFVSRQEIETKGEAYNRGRQWYDADFHLYAQPPQIGPPPPDPVKVADQAAEVRRLRAEAADAHPDRGGTNAAFREAYARYMEACRALKGTVGLEWRAHR